MKDFLTGAEDPLQDPLIRNYYETNLALVRSIVFKHKRAAELLNQTMLDRYGGGVPQEWNTGGQAWIADEPATWKYYVNLAGEYHITDRFMEIVSLDTRETIIFSKEVLNERHSTGDLVHPLTVEAYRIGTRYYQTLVSRFPDQEDVIMGIIMPCDLDEALEAPDGAIVRYDRRLVEAQEHSLIKDLETHIQRNMERWYVDAFRKTDTYFLTAYHSGVYLTLLPKLLNLRLARCKTHEVHSFHVKMFLRSHLGLDRFYDQMTLEQALYLYRNIPRLAYYMGHTDQFVELIQHILTKRSIPISGYTARHLFRLADPVNYTGQYPKDYAPVPIVQTDRLNEFVNYNETSLVRLEDAFDKEKGVLYGTPDFYAAHQEKSIFKIRNNIGSKSLTKDLVSQTIFYEGTIESELRTMTLSHWAYLSAKNLYNVEVDFKDPSTEEIVTSNTKDVFVYLYYLTLSYLGYEKDYIEGVINQYLCERIARFFVLENDEDKVEVQNEILEMVPRDESGEAAAVYRNAASYLVDRIATMPTVQTPLTSTQQFYDLCNNLNSFRIVQSRVYGTVQSHEQLGYLRGMVSRFYQDEKVQLVPSNFNLDAFLSENGFRYYEETGEFLADLITALYKVGTNSIDFYEPVEPDVHRAMIGIMKALTSYNIQFIDTQVIPDRIPIVCAPMVSSDQPNIPGLPDNRLIANIFIPAGIHFQDVSCNFFFVNCSDAVLIGDSPVVNVSDAILIDDTLATVNVSDAELIIEP